MTASSRLCWISPEGWGAVLAFWIVGFCFGPAPAHAQAPLHLVNDQTSVREISFRFVGDNTFEASRLQEQIATAAPGFFARLQNRFSFLPGLQRQSFLFDPVTLQKDVVRLRRFYQQNGFPNPHIDYPASQLDTTTNEIHVIFLVREGTPLTIRDVSHLGPEGQQPVTNFFSTGLQRAWARFLGESSLTTGERYTDFKRTQSESEIQTWLRNQGYAFATVQAQAQMDTAATAVDLRFLIDPGPLATVSEIRVEGNSSVSNRIVLRELPFTVGDRFSAEEVSEGQRQLFDLNLFRVALADVPEQPRDSTVTVRYRVREAKLRAYSGQIGYGTRPGVTMEGSWRHRNFRGNARTLAVNLTADTGFPEDPARIFPFLSTSTTKAPNRLFRASATLRQPYLFWEQLSGSIEPFIQERRSVSLDQNPDRAFSLLERLGLNERQFGLNTTFIYTFLPFRSLSLQHTLARTEQFGSAVTTDSVRARTDDLFDKSIFTLNGTFGKANDFINPTRGFIIRPSTAVGGGPFGSDVNFWRGSLEISGYVPVSESIQLAGRVFAGGLYPFGESRSSLTIPPDADSTRLDRNQTFQDRFSDQLFYAGGGSDVRGWRSQLAGGKALRNIGTVTEPDYAYRPIGARSKVGVNLEARLPFPGLGDSWRTAVFVDAAYLETGELNLVPAPGVSDVVAVDGRPVRTNPSRLLVGSGAGLRYKTPFGFIRLDLAYKLTPDRLDLRRPNEIGEQIENGAPVRSAQTHPIRRFRFHFGIGRSF